MKGITKTIENDTKAAKRRILGMLLVVSGATLLRNKFTGNGILKPGYGNNWGKVIIRAGYGSMRF